VTARKKNQLLTIEVVNGSERTLAALSLLINAAIAWHQVSLPNVESAEQLLHEAVAELLDEIGDGEVN
jgi:hypothetical protein